LSYLDLVVWVWSDGDNGLSIAGTDLRGFSLDTIAMSLGLFSVILASSYIRSFTRAYPYNKKAKKNMLKSHLEQQTI